MSLTNVLGIAAVVLGLLAVGPSLASAQSKWSYSPELLRPFWEGQIVEGESVLFIRNEQSGEARASVLFPIREILAVKNSAGDATYENGKDFVWKPDSREIIVPRGSRIPTWTPRDLRRPAKTQKYELTHRDGEIFFGAQLEYAAMQTCITYRHAPDSWKSYVPQFDPGKLPRSVSKLVNRQPLSIVVVGDSISAGCNASGWAEQPPFQPAYPELVRSHLEARFRSQVSLAIPAVNGGDSASALKLIDKVVEPRPDLVIVAFGMNDAAGRPAAEFHANIAALMTKIRERSPDVEFILTASMLGNRNWTRLHPELFPEYRDALAKRGGPGVALADMTSLWTRFLELKQDWDLTGNGVNHPNDFGHRVYAQVITTLLDPRGEPSAAAEPPTTIEAGPLKLIEQRLLGNYTYSYACAAFDLDGDGDLDLTSSDAEPNSNLYLLLNDGQGGFRHSFIQKYAGQGDQPIRLERHAVGDVNRDGRPDIVIVDNLKSDIRWFENTGDPKAGWKQHAIKRDWSNAVTVILADLDRDGRPDIVACAERGANELRWWRNAGPAR